MENFRWRYNPSFDEFLKHLSYFGPTIFNVYTCTTCRWSVASGAPIAACYGTARDTDVKRAVDQCERYVRTFAAAFSRSRSLARTGGSVYRRFVERPFETVAITHGGEEEKESSQ